MKVGVVLHTFVHAPAYIDGGQQIYLQQEDRGRSDGRRFNGNRCRIVNLLGIKSNVACACLGSGNSRSVDSSDRS